MIHYQVYTDPVRTIIIEPEIREINGNQYITYHWQGAEIAIIKNLPEEIMEGSWIN